MEGVEEEPSRVPKCRAGPGLRAPGRSQAGCVPGAAAGAHGRCREGAGARARALSEFRSLAWPFDRTDSGASPGPAPAAVPGSGSPGRGVGIPAIGVRCAPASEDPFRTRFTLGAGPLGGLYPEPCRGPKGSAGAGVGVSHSSPIRT